MDDLDYIKRFSKINIKGICEKTKVNRSNLLNGRASKNKVSKIKKQIESEVAKLYIIEDNNEKGES